MAEEKFVKLKYTGKVKETGEVFDSAEEKVIPLTSGYILEGFEERLLDRKVGEDFKITLKPKEAFGKRDPDKLQVLPKSRFKDKKAPLRKGARYNINGEIATVKSITGGRVMVDFNHPLAGKTIQYEGKILEKIEKDRKKGKSILEAYGLGDKEFKIEEDTLKVKVEEEVPNWLKEKIKDDVEEYLDLGIKFKKIKEKEDQGEEKV